MMKISNGPDNKDTLNKHFNTYQQNDSSTCGEGAARIVEFPPQAISGSNVYAETLGRSRVRGGCFCVKSRLVSLRHCPADREDTKSYRYIV